MSETERRTGKLTPVAIVGDIENTAKLLVESMNQVKEVWCDTYLEKLLSDSEDFVAIKDLLYKVDYEDSSDDGDIFNAWTNPDGTINFLVQYYNGGCCMGDAIGYAVDKMQKKETP